MSGHDIQDAPNFGSYPGEESSPRRRTQPGGGAPVGQMPRELAEPQLIAWPQHLAAIVGASLLAVAAAMLAGHPVLSGVVAAAGIAGTIMLGIRGYRGNQRRRLVADLSNQLSTQLRAIIRVEKAKRWTDQGPQLLVISYSAAAAAVYNTMLPTQICAALTVIAGSPHAIERHTPRRRRLVIATKPEAEAKQVTPLQERTARVSDIAVQTFGAGSSVSDVISDEDDLITGFTVHYTSGPKMTVESIRARMTDAMTQRMPGKWRTHVDLANDQLRVELSAPLPRKIDRAADPIEKRRELMIPMGIDEDRRTVWWDVSGVMAHQLIAGKTRTGKTVSLIGTTVEGCRRGWETYIVDPKRIEFLGMRTWPNVRMVATKVEDQVAVITYVHELMMERYRLVEEEGADEASFARILLVVDEFRILYSQIKAWWATVKVSGMPAQCPALEYLGALLRMAAAAHIHVVLGMQRPDAEILGGEERDNFSMRAATGELGAEGAQMMFNNPRIGSSIPGAIQGRGTITSVDDRPREIQYFYTPDPRKVTSAEELAMLETLRPATTTWERVMVSYPSDEEAHELVDESAARTSVAWEKVLNASFIPWDPTVTTTEAAPAEPADGYGPASHVPAGQIQVGDLVGLDEDDDLVTITGVDDSGTDTVFFVWSDDQGRIGEHEISLDEALNTRKPKKAPPTKKKRR